VHEYASRGRQFKLLCLLVIEDPIVPFLFELISLPTICPIAGGSVGFEPSMP